MVTAHMVFLGGPTVAEGADEDDAIMWRAFLAHRLAQAGIASYNPVLATTSPEIIARQIAALTEAAIDACDYLVVNLSEHIDQEEPAALLNSYAQITYGISKHKEIILIDPLHRSLLSDYCEQVGTLEEGLAFILGGVGLVTMQPPERSPQAFVPV